MNFWDRIFYGNSLKDWATAVTIILIAFSAIRIVSGPVLRKIKNWSAKTSNTFDDLLILTIKKFVVPFLYFAAIFAAFKYLTFNGRVNNIIKVATLFVITFFILRLVSAAIQYSVFTFLGKQENSETKQKQARGLIIILKSLVWILGIIFLIDNLGYNVTTIITGLGIGGIAIALAAQTILGDLFSYFVIFFDRPFEIGDFIIVGEQVGSVEYIGIKTTRIRAITGEQIVCSNKDLTDSRVHNYKRMMKRRVVFNIGIVSDTPPEQIEKIPLAIKKIIESKPELQFDRSHLSALGDFSLNFENVYYVLNSDYNLYMDLQQRIYLEIIEYFKKEKIDFAFPTQTLVAANSFIQVKEKSWVE